MGCSSSEFENDCQKQFELAFQGIRQVFHTTQQLSKHEKDVFTYLWNSHLLSFLQAYRRQHKDLQHLIQEKVSTEESIKKLNVIFAQLKKSFRDLNSQINNAGKRRDDTAKKLKTIQKYIEAPSTVIQQRQVSHHTKMQIDTSAQSSRFHQIAQFRQIGQILSKETEKQEPLQLLRQSSYQTEDFSQVNRACNEPSVEIEIEQVDTNHRQKVEKNSSLFSTTISQIEAKNRQLEKLVKEKDLQISKLRKLVQSLSQQNVSLKAPLQAREQSDSSEKDHRPISHSVFEKTCTTFREEFKQLLATNVQQQGKIQVLQNQINKTMQAKADSISSHHSINRTQPLSPLKADGDTIILLSLFAHSRMLPDFQSFDKAVHIRRQLKSLFGPVIRTEMLYYFDQVNIIHYEKYIKNRTGLCLLISLPNGVIVGGYQGTPLNNGKFSDSFIFSLHKDRPPIKLTASSPTNRIDNDLSCLSFGNGQIKMRAKSLNFSCNVGGFNSVYSNNGKNPNLSVFLEGGKHEQEANSYEVHSIFLQNEKQ